MKASAGIQKERDKIARDEARVGDDCVSQKWQLLNSERNR